MRGVCGLYGVRGGLDVGLRDMVYYRETCGLNHSDLRADAEYYEVRCMLRLRVMKPNSFEDEAKLIEGLHR